MVFHFFLFFVCFILLCFCFSLIDYFLMYKRTKCGFGWSEKWGRSGRSRGRGNCEQNILYEKKTFKKQNSRIQWEIKWPLDLCRSGPGGRDEGERTEGRTALSLQGIGALPPSLRSVVTVPSGGELGCVSFRPVGRQDVGSGLGRTWVRSFGQLRGTRASCPQRRRSFLSPQHGFWDTLNLSVISTTGRSACGFWPD